MTRGLIIISGRLKATVTDVKASVAGKNSILESCVFPFLGAPRHLFFSVVVRNRSVGYGDDSREEVASLSAVANARALRLRHKPRS